MSYEKRPWNKQSSSETKMWVLRRETKLGAEVINSEPVAMFNFDSEGTTFQKWLFGGGKIQISDDTRELCESLLAIAKPKPETNAHEHSNYYHD